MAYTSPSITPSGTTFAQFQGGGTSGQLERLITANLQGTAAPATPTLSATGGGTTGGNLAPGPYYVKVTETNGIGETTPSAEVSVTIASGNIPQVTFAPLQAGNTARNVYVGTASGAEVPYSSGITAGTYNFSAPIPINSYAVPVPTTNTTGLISVTAATGVVGNQKLVGLRASEKGRLQGVWNNLSQVIDQFNRGEPVAFNNLTSKLRDAHTVFAMLSQLCSEMGTLIDANPGHFTNAPTGIGGQKTVRQWP
jgi:hypothetical protein